MTTLTKVDAFKAIKASTENIRKHPTDTDGVVNYETGKILEIIEPFLLEE